MPACMYCAATWCVGNNLLKASLSHVLHPPTLFLPDPSIILLVVFFPSVRPPRDPFPTVRSILMHERNHPTWHSSAIYTRTVFSFFGTIFTIKIVILIKEECQALRGAVKLVPEVRVV